MPPTRHPPSRSRSCKSRGRLPPHRRVHRVAEPLIDAEVLLVKVHGMRERRRADVGPQGRIVREDGRLEQVPNRTRMLIAAGGQTDRPLAAAMARLLRGGSTPHGSARAGSYPTARQMLRASSQYPIYKDHPPSRADAAFRSETCQRVVASIRRAAATRLASAIRAAGRVRRLVLKAVHESGDCKLAVIARIALPLCSARACTAAKERPLVSSCASTLTS